MATMQPPRNRRDGWLGALGVLAVVAISAWYRTPGFEQGGFASHDVAGILYNAMLLHDGGLPYVDSVELKAPGSFWLAKWLAGPEGRDIARFQIWANAAGLASVVAVAAVAWRAFGARAAVVAAAVYALHDAHLDSMDANYVTWAQLPSIIAVGWGLAAIRAQPAAARVGWVLAGVAAGLAMLLKRPAIAIALWCGLMALWRGGSTLRARHSCAACVVAGVLLAHLPIVVRYAVAGHLATLLSAYGLSEWGLAYVGGGGRSDGTPVAVDGAWATVHVLALAAALAAAAWRAPAEDPDRDLVGPIWAWVGLVLAFAAVGARFYKGYFLAVAPALAVAAAVPWGPLGGRAAARLGARLVLLVPALVLLGRQVVILHKHRAQRGMVHDAGGRAIARHVTAHSQPGDRIWVWGWHLWDVYPLTGLRSGSTIYKSMGVLTRGNDDTWRLPASRARFVDGPYAQRLVDELEHSRPVWIVLGSTVPRGEFRSLTALLRREYRLDSRVRLGRVQFWWRADRARAYFDPGGGAKASSSSGS
jgi:hypothetical protein